jgi:hypothetical protein
MPLSHPDPRFTDSDDRDARLGVRLSQRDRDDLEAVANQHNLAMSEVARQFIRAGIASLSERPRRRRRPVIH